MPADMRVLADDLAAETMVLRDLVAGLDQHGWQTPTPAIGWSIADQLSHLGYFDDAAKGRRGASEFLRISRPENAGRGR